MSFLDRLSRILGGTPSDKDHGQGHGHGHVHGRHHVHGSLTCEEAVSLLYDYLDGELEEVSEEGVKAHFEACQECYPHMRFEESFRAAIQRAGSGEHCPDELKAHLLELLDKAGSEG